MKTEQPRFVAEFQEKADEGQSQDKMPWISASKDATVAYMLGRRTESIQVAAMRVRRVTDSGR